MLELGTPFLDHIQFPRIRPKHYLLTEHLLPGFLSFRKVLNMGNIDADTDCLKNILNQRMKKMVNAGLHPIDEHRYQLHGSSNTRGYLPLHHFSTC